MIRWGFLGAGGISTNALAPAVHAASGATLHAVGARDATRAEALEPAVAYDSYDAVLADPDVDAVYIGLANDQHVPWTLRAIKAGKPVLCEKPLGLSVSEVDSLVAAGGLVVEAFWYRWHPRTREAERLVAAGAIGAVRHVTSAFVFDHEIPAGNYRLDPALGGGALYDVGCYAVSAALWAFGGEPPAEVSVRRALGPSGVDLTTHAILSWDGGDAEIRSGFAGPTEQRLVITGEAGEIELPEPVFSVRDQAVQLWISDGTDTRRIDYPAVNPYQLMVEAFSAHLRGEAAWLPELSESRAVAATLDAIRAQ